MKIGPALGVVLVLSLISPGVAGAQAGGVTVTVECYGDPERATVRDNTGSVITVQSIDNLNDLHSGEP